MYLFILIFQCALSGFNVATENSGRSLLIVRYDWILKDLEKDLQSVKTITSNLILFRGEKVFRLALKKSVGEMTLVFLAINLNKIGLRIADVACAKEGVDVYRKMKESEPNRKKTEKNSQEGHLQLLLLPKWLDLSAKSLRFKFISKELYLNIHLTRVIASEKTSCGRP